MLGDRLAKRITQVKRAHVLSWVFLTVIDVSCRATKQLAHMLQCYKTMLHQNDTKSHIQKFKKPRQKCNFLPTYPGMLELCLNSLGKVKDDGHMKRISSSKS